MKYFIYILAMLPAVALLNVGISLDPYDAIIELTGRWMMIWFILLLALGPLMRSFRIKSGVIGKQPLGLAVFTWAMLHVFGYFVYHSQPLQKAFLELLIRPFLLLGVVAFVVIVGLGLTSSKWAIRLMGKKWNVLHKLSIWGAALGAAHGLVAQKTSLNEFGVYSLLILIMILWRGITAIRKV